MYTLLTEFCSKEIILYFSPNVNSKILIFSRENFQDSGFPFKSAPTAPPRGVFLVKMNILPGRKYQNIYIEKPEKYAIMSAE